MIVFLAERHKFWTHEIRSMVTLENAVIYQNVIGTRNKPKTRNYREREYIII